MIKTIQFDNYDEVTVRKTIEAFTPFGKNGMPHEISVLLNGKRFVFTGESADHYIAQINATQTALNNVK
jgi:hypothetical protein